MLRIIQNSAPASAKSYYSKSDYWSEGQEQVGKWGGKLAAMLGLEGKVRKADFDRMCDNRHPQTGAQLTPRTRTDRTVLYDFNFHWPKGVSVAYALYGDDRIVKAAEQSVEEMMNEAEPDMRTRMRREGANAERVTGNWAWGMFTHLTARPVDGYPDMHGHHHVCVFNATWDDVDECVKAGQFREIQRDAPYFEAAFHARFAKRLAEMGYTIERKGRSWDIAEVPQPVRDIFSRRTELIERIAEEDNVIDPREKDKLGGETRERKQTNFSMDQLREIWWAQLTDEQRDALAALATRKHLAARTSIELNGGMDEALSHAKLHCFERQSVVAERVLLAEALRRGVGRVDVEAMCEQLQRSDVIRRKFRGRNMVTTPAVLGEEDAIIAFASNGRGKAQPLNLDWTIQRDWLNTEQRIAIRRLLFGRDTVMLLRGGAGTGKTSLMQEAVAGIKAGGHRVLALAPSSQASRDVLRSEGFPDATTVAEFLVNSDLQATVKGQVIWIDEAGLLSSKTLKQVFDLAKEINCRIILAGDVSQHGSVQRGAALSLLEQHAGLKVAEVSAIQRQKDQYREAVQCLAGGDVSAGTDKLNQLGWIKELPTDERLAAIANDYADSTASGMSTLVVCPTHAEGKNITQSIRQRLKSDKRISKDEEQFEQLLPLHFTEAERRDAAFWRKGDVVVFHQNAKGYKKGKRIVIGDEVPRDLLEQAGRFGMFRRANLSIAACDMIRITGNGKSVDGKHRLFNGATYRVKELTKDGDLKLANGWIISRSYGFLDHGYVSTSHASQGKTVDHAILAESSASFPAASREQFYVSASRGRRKCTIYTDDAEGLRDAVEDSSVKLTAWELLRADRMRRQCQLTMIGLARQQAATEGTLAYGR